MSESGVLRCPCGRCEGRPLARVFLSVWRDTVVQYARLHCRHADVFALSGRSADVVVTCSHGDACLPYERAR